MSKQSLNLQTVLLHSEDIKAEITNRLHSRVQDFEIVEYDSGRIGVHWCAYFNGEDIIINIPHEWTIAHIDWKEKYVSMYAYITDFLTEF